MEDVCLFIYLFSVPGPHIWRANTQLLILLANHAEEFQETKTGI